MVFPPPEIIYRQGDDKVAAHLSKAGVHGSSVTHHLPANKVTNKLQNKVESNQAAARSTKTSAGEDAASLLALPISAALPISLPADDKAAEGSPLSLPTKREFIPELADQSPSMDHLRHLIQQEPKVVSELLRKWINGDE